MTGFDSFLQIKVQR
jgi:hypothetical protein